MATIRRQSRELGWFQIFWRGVEAFAAVATSSAAFPAVGLAFLKALAMAPKREEMGFAPAVSLSITTVAWAGVISTSEFVKMPGNCLLA